jgi:hypothetical protein
MVNLSAKKIDGLVVALILLGILLPIGLSDLMNFTSTDSKLETLVVQVIPIVAVIGFVCGKNLKFKENG